MRVFGSTVLVFLLVLFLMPGLALAADEQTKQVAIDNGLNWLATQQSAAGYWNYGGGRNDVAATASALLAYIEEGHLPGVGVHGTTVQNGVNWLLNRAIVSSTVWESTGPGDHRHAEDYNYNGVLDDGGNGDMVYFYSNDIYSNGLVAPVIHALGDALGQNTLITTGALTGRSYRTAMQDVVDWFSWAQVEPNRGVHRGGWRYAPNYGTSDNSTAQWGALPMLYAADWGLGVPQYVKDELTRWVNYIQNANGGSGYDHPNSLVNMAKTGGLLLELAAIGAPISDLRVQAALQYIAANWNFGPSSTWNGNLNHPYAMWAVYKGLEVYGLTQMDPGPDGILGTADDYLIGFGVPTAPGGFTIGQNWGPDLSAVGDWYSHYSDLIVGLQGGGGNWAGYSNWHSELAAGWYINILNATGAPQPHPAVPEPTTFVLLGAGVAGLAAMRRRRKKQAA